MMTPDRNIVKKIKNYDKDLFVKWNNKDQWFELWRKKTVGEDLITPIVYSIYDSSLPMVYCDLDERILAWIYWSDSWRLDNVRDHLLENDRRMDMKFIEDRKKQRSEFRDMAKDIWNIKNARSVTTYKKKNSKYPKFNSKKVVNKWVRPDSVARTSNRLYARTGENAIKYFGPDKG